MCMHNKSCFCL